MDKANFKVSGLKNSSKKTSVKNALNKLDGVKEVCVDIKKGTIEVAHIEEIKEEKIKDCIQKTGCEVQSEIEW